MNRKEGMKKAQGILFLMIFFFCLPLSGQELVRFEEFTPPAKGRYKKLSTDKEFIDDAGTSISPQNKAPEESEFGFVKVPEQGMALFDGVKGPDTSEAVAVLKKNSFVQVDSIFERKLYRDGTKNTFSFDVWYSIRINGTRYYTDHKPHRRTLFRKELEELGQELLLVAQNQGYAEFYANGYPERFFVVILDENNEKEFESDVLDFEYGREYWAGKAGSIEARSKDDGWHFSLSGREEELHFRWDGSDLAIEP